MNEFTPEQRHRLAVEVMEWLVPGDLPCSGGLWDGNRTHLVAGSDLHTWRHEHGIKDSSAEFLWQPDQCIEQAFMVSEKLGMLILRQARLDTPTEQRGWFASFAGVGDMFDVMPAMAICLAALRWMDRQGKRKSHETHSLAATE